MFCEHDVFSDQRVSWLHYRTRTKKTPSLITKSGRLEPSMGRHQPAMGVRNVRRDRLNKGVRHKFPN